MSNHLLNPTLAVTVLMNLKSQCISARISVLQIDICTVATLIYNILYCVGDSIAERNNFTQDVITKIMAVGSQYSIKIAEHRLRKISTEPFFISARRQIQFAPRLYRRVVVATLGVDSHPGGGKGPAAGAFVNTGRKSPNLLLPSSLSLLISLTSSTALSRHPARSVARKKAGCGTALRPRRKGRPFSRRHPAYQNTWGRRQPRGCRG